MNMVSVTISGVKMEVDIDARWSDFKKMPFEDQLETVTCSYFWMSQIFGVGLDVPAMNRFWANFQRPEAEKARDVAVNGITRVNNHALFSLLKSAMDFERDRAQGVYKDNHESGMMDGYVLGLRFAELATRKDPADFRRMAAMIKNGGEIEGARGGEDTFHGEIVREFCQYVSNTRTLPTKKEIREGLGISSDDKDKTEILRKSLIKLGLSGLPQSRKA